MSRRHRRNPALLRYLIGAFSLFFSSLIRSLAIGALQVQPPQAKRRARPAAGRLRI